MISTRELQEVVDRMTTLLGNDLLLERTKGLARWLHEAFGGEFTFTVGYRGSASDRDHAPHITVVRRP